MRSRGLVVALALLLAIGATAAVFLYVNGVKENALNSGDIVSVIVADQNIPANSNLDNLIDQGAFKPVNVPKDVAVTGAVTSIDQLRGQTNTVPILANEQIPAERLAGGQQVQGGRLGICEACVGLTLQVDGPAGVGGSVQLGDNLTLYASFSGVKGFQNVRSLLNQLNGTGPAAQANATSTESLPPFTMTLLPTVKVLKVENPNPDAEGRTSNGSVTVTLDVPREDAEFVVFAAQSGSLWFGLLPPGQDGLQLPAQSVSINRILGKRQP